MVKEEDQRIAVADMVVMKKAVKDLSFGSPDEKGEAVAEIGRLARLNGQTRRQLAELGVIPMLVSMLVDHQSDRYKRLVVAGALLELARGTFKNKVLMVKAGILKKLPQLMEYSNDFSTQQELALLLLSISSLVETDFSFSSSNIIPLLIKTIKSKEVAHETKMSCLATIHNLSRKIENTKAILSNGAVHALITLSLDKTTSEIALSVLGNIVLSATGKKEIEEQAMVPKVFVEVMTWHENPKCQELAAYLIMVLAHGNHRQRHKMHELGLVQVLLEVALLGSPLAQKRAAKIIQWFKDEGKMRMRAHSGPRTEEVQMHDEIGNGWPDTKMALRKMVKQSLDRNMTSILRRASASEDFTNVKSFAASSSSKSLPY